MLSESEGRTPRRPSLDGATQRAQTIVMVADHVLGVQRDHPLRVSVDGRTAAGKTTFSDYLAEALRSRTQRQVIRVGLDYFKKARHLRLAYPNDSPESYYLDSWDYPAIRVRLLEPLGPNGSCRYTEKIMNLWATEVIHAPEKVASHDAIVIIDGAFAQRPELDGCWDLVIWLDVDENHSFRRGLSRDAATIGPETEQRYRSKYLPGERRYIDEVRPEERADVVIDNRNLFRPRIVRIGR